MSSVLCSGMTGVSVSTFAGHKRLGTVFAAEVIGLAVSRALRATRVGIDRHTTHRIDGDLAWMRDFNTRFDFAPPTGYVTRPEAAQTVRIGDYG